jgi:hypothetical protein
MVSKMCRIASMIVLATFASSSAAWAATCSNASLSGTYGFMHGGTDSPVSHRNIRSRLELHCDGRGHGCQRHSGRAQLSNEDGICAKHSPYNFHHSIEERIHEV